MPIANKRLEELEASEWAGAPTDAGQPPRCLGCGGSQPKHRKNCPHKKAMDSARGGEDAGPQQRQKTFIAVFPDGKYLPGEGDPTNLLDKAAKFNNQADARIAIEKAIKIVELPPYLLDPTTGQYTGLKGGKS